MDNKFINKFNEIRDIRKSKEDINKKLIVDLEKLVLDKKEEFNEFLNFVSVVAHGSESQKFKKFMFDELFCNFDENKDLIIKEDFEVKKTDKEDLVCFECERNNTKNKQIYEVDPMIDDDKAYLYNTNSFHLFRVIVDDMHTRLTILYHLGSYSENRYALQYNKNNNRIYYYKVINEKINENNTAKYNDLNDNDVNLQIKVVLLKLFIPIFDTYMNRINERLDKLKEKLEVES